MGIVIFYMYAHMRTHSVDVDRGASHTWHGGMKLRFLLMPSHMSWFCRPGTAVPRFTGMLELFTTRLVVVSFERDLGKDVQNPENTHNRRNIRSVLGLGLPTFS